MDLVLVKSTFWATKFNLSSCKSKYLTNTSFSFFKFSQFQKQTIPVLSNSKPNTLPSKCNPRFSFRPFRQLVPIVQTIRVLVISETQKLFPSLRGSHLKTISDEFEGSCLQNGSLGMALVSATTTAKVRISPLLATLAANPTFISGLLAWALAQSMKVILNFFLERKWDFGLFCASGGMPSSHSALCTALTTSVALCHGVADSLFPVCLGFSLIVMYDAIGVRRHAGMQAEVSDICSFFLLEKLLHFDQDNLLTKSNCKLEYQSNNLDCINKVGMNLGSIDSRVALKFYNVLIFAKLLGIVLLLSIIK